MIRPRRGSRALRWLAAASCALLLATACASPQTVSLAPAWPERGGDYKTVQQAWTRAGRLRDGFDQVLSVHATFLSPAWRTAWVDRRVRVERLSPSARATMLEEQHELDAEHYEVALMITTYERTENDLQKGEKSVWRVALIDDHGVELESASIVRDRRPEKVIRAQFPDLEDFGTAYLARFPRRVELLRTDARAMRLRISSARGAVVLEWKAP
jgi:hypothetical protein